MLMKQAEKNRKSRDLILKHAFAEFAGNGYAGSSLNLICARGEISKGLLYHYYPNKDALYLACVKKLFDEMTAFLSGRIELPGVTVAQYFSVRMQFFQQHPAHRQLFYDVLMYPPAHLADRINTCRAAFDDLNNAALRSVLTKEHLSDRIPMEEAIRQFRAFVNFLGVYIREDTAADAESTAQKLLDTLLYGLIARGPG